MPASEVMRLYREHKLHSGPGGPIVKNPKQATAIQISMARKEGHHIPYPKEKKSRMARAYKSRRERSSE